MSRYDWEKGDIRIPRSEFTTFKKDLIFRYNFYLIVLQSKAKAIYEICVQDSKGKRNYNYESKITELILSLIGSDLYATRMVSESLLPVNKQGKPKKPKAKNFPKKTNRDEIFGYHLTINQAKRTAFWRVPKGFNASFNARESFVGKLFFKTLSEVEWKNGSGGSIIGNDQVNNDSQLPDGGANYTKTTYQKRKNHEQTKV